MVLYRERALPSGVLLSKGLILPNRYSYYIIIILHVVIRVMSVAPFLAVHVYQRSPFRSSSTSHLALEEFQFRLFPEHLRFSHADFSLCNADVRVRELVSWCKHESTTLTSSSMVEAYLQLIVFLVRFLRSFQLLFDGLLGLDLSIHIFTIRFTFDSDLRFLCLVASGLLHGIVFGP